MTFNGVDPNSVVILDNCSSFTMLSGLESCIEDVGAFLSIIYQASSPDYNPIEMLSL